MSKNNQIKMPSSGAGLTTFYDESKSKILISPQIVLGIVIIIGVTMMVLNYIN